MKTKPPKLIEYQVSGIGPFPTDMLRYDDAKIVEADTAKAQTHERRSVRIVGERCTQARWRSFGWTVFPMGL